MVLIKITIKTFKIILIVSLTILSFFILSYFYYFNQKYNPETPIELKINAMFTIFYFIIIFYILMFLIEYNLYNKIFICVVIFGMPLWIITYLLQLFKIEPGLWDWSIIRRATVIFCFAILSPGLTLNFMEYIKKTLKKKNNSKVFRKYHLHEGFVGILFVIIAIFLWIFHNLLIQHEIMKGELRIFLAIDTILLILFLFTGSFLIFRDWNDLIHLKFVKRTDDMSKNCNQNKVSSVFSQVSQESVSFFKFSRVLYYPFGILLNSFSLSVIIHGTYFLPEEIFSLEEESIFFLGCICCFIAGGMIGRDWYRLFAKIYPELYQEIERELYILNK